VRRDGPDGRHAWRIRQGKAEPERIEPAKEDDESITRRPRAGASWQVKLGTILRSVAIFPVILTAIFGVAYAVFRSKGGYRAVRIEEEGRAHEAHAAGVSEGGRTVATGV
jgi:hypothetical protein